MEYNPSFLFILMSSMCYIYMVDAQAQNKTKFKCDIHTRLVYVCYMYYIINGIHIFLRLELALFYYTILIIILNDKS